MLEQWEADLLLRGRKIYSQAAVVDLGRGADNDYQVETTDGNEFFLLDVRGPGRNPGKACFQLRYRREIVLARMCLAAPHTNPDGAKVPAPHFHRFHEDYHDKIAEHVAEFETLGDALEDFCRRINLPVPTIQGGLA